MSRLPVLHREDLDWRGHAAWDLILSARPRALSAEGTLNQGPLNAWVHAPDVGARLMELGQVLRSGTSLDQRLLELATITVAAEWKAEFEWYWHSRAARELGVPGAAIDAIGLGKTPSFEADNDRVVYAVARQLAEEGRIDDSTYELGQRLFGDRGRVELVSLCGSAHWFRSPSTPSLCPCPRGCFPNGRSEGACRSGEDSALDRRIGQSRSDILRGRRLLPSDRTAHGGPRTLHTGRRERGWRHREHLCGLVSNNRHYVAGPGNPRRESTTSGSRHQFEARAGDPVVGGMGAGGSARAVPSAPRLLTRG